MSTAPLVSEQLLAIGQALLIGAASLLALFIVLGASVYLAFCMRSNRQWNGFEERWQRPR